MTVRGKTWLIDLDGTLIESDQIWSQAYTRIFDDLDLPVLSYYQLLRDGIMKSVGTISYITAVLKHIGSSLDPVILTDRVYGVAYEIFRKEGFILKPGTDMILGLLRREKVALVTGSTQAISDLFIELFPGVFDNVVTAEDVKNQKPSPDSYLLAMKLLDADPRQCIAIEDSPPGIRSARAAGCNTVIGAGPRGSELLQAGASVICSSLEDLVYLISLSMRCGP